MVNKELPRSGVYRYSDLLLSRAYSCYCGATSKEDVNYLRDTFSHLSGFDLSSADTILRMESGFIPKIV